MTYEFSLEKKTLAQLLAGMAVVGGLLFAAGVIVGLQLNQTRNEPAEVAGATKDQSASISPAKVSPPSAPATRPPQEESRPLPTKAPLGAPQSETKTATPAAAESAKPAPDKASAPTQQSRSQPNYSVSVSPGATVPDAPPGKTTFMVQVGAFLKKENAMHLREELQGKGYSAHLQQFANGQAGRWYAVRLGPFADQDDARQAAVEFAQQEKRTAIVRPYGSL